MNKKRFYAAIRKTVFSGKLTQDQVDGVEGVLSSFATHGDGKPDTLAYGLATAFHETGGAMTPNRENLYYTRPEHILRTFGSRRAGGIRTARSLARKPKALACKVYDGHLGNIPGTDDGWTYRGGGYMHLTGRGNYAASSEDAGVDLVEQPEAILDPEISGRVLWCGLLDGRWNGKGKGEGIRHYLDRIDEEGNPNPDWTGARRTVNGDFHAARVAGPAEKFLKAIERAS